MSGALTAESIGAAARQDPQLKVPVYPRMRRGVQVKTAEGKVTVVGLPSRQVFKGKTAATLLPRLLPLLEGSQDHRQLAESCAVTEEVIFRVVSLLWTSGIVEEGPPEEGACGIADEVADYLSRLGDSTGANTTWEEAANRWLNATIGIAGEPALAEQFRDEFEIPDPLQLITSSTVGPDADLIILLEEPEADSSETQARLETIVRNAWSQGTPLIRFRLDSGVARIGPYANPRFTPCLDCLTDQEPEPAGLPGTADRDLGLSLLAREVFAVVTRAVQSHIPGRTRLLDLTTWTSTEHTGATRPGCQVCSESTGSAPSAAPMSVRYEASVAMPPKEFADNKAHQKHYQPSNTALQHRFRTWPSASRVQLPDPELESLAHPRNLPTAEVSAADLSVMLTVADGIQAAAEQRVLRWTACGGNIGSVLPYVVIRQGSTELPAGIYAWLSQETSLARISTNPDLIPGKTPVSVVMAGDYLKVAQKYGAFALRIVLLDSGCAQMALQKVAEHLGIPVSRRQRWQDEAISRGLGSDPESEPITAVIDLGGDL